MPEAEKEASSENAGNPHVQFINDPTYRSVLEWEGDEKQSTSSNVAEPQDFVPYYRGLSALHPRCPFDEFGRDTQPTLFTATLVTNGTHIRPVPNVKVSIEVLNMDNMDGGSDKVRLHLKLRMLWKPALPEIRESDEMDITYKSLPDDSFECQKTILQLRQSADWNTGPVIMPTFIGPGEPPPVVPQQPPPFLGPFISLQTTCGERDDPFFTETRLRENFSLAREGTIHVRKDEFPRTPASGDLLSPWNIEVEHRFTELLSTAGGRRGFPFDTQTATLHIHSASGLQDVAFHEFDQLDQENLKNRIRQLSSRNLRWTINDIQVLSGYRTLNGEEYSTVEISSKYRLDSFRSKIVLKLTFGRNKAYWYLKLIFPLDVITIAGFCTFLVIPTLTSPTPDQQISLLTFLAGILIALSAFTISAQAALPSLDYMTVLDIHSYFCFAVIGVLAIVVAANPSANLALFKNVEIIGDKRRHGLLFAILLITLVLEHLVIYGLVSWVWVLPARSPGPSYQDVGNTYAYPNRSEMAVPIMIPTSRPSRSSRSPPSTRYPTVVVQPPYERHQPPLSPVRADRYARRRHHSRSLERSRSPVSPFMAIPAHHWRSNIRSRSVSPSRSIYAPRSRSSTRVYPQHYSPSRSPSSRHPIPIYPEPSSPSLPSAPIIIHHSRGSSSDSYARRRSGYQFSEGGDAAYRNVTPASYKSSSSEAELSRRGRSRYIKSAHREHSKEREVYPARPKAGLQSEEDAPVLPRRTKGRKV